MAKVIFAFINANGTICSIVQGTENRMRKRERESDVTELFLFLNEL